MGFVGGEVKEPGLVDGGRIAFIHPFTGPIFEDLLNELGDGSIGSEGRTEIESRGQLGVERRKRRRSQARAEPEVAGERFQHMLPRTGRNLVAHRNGITGYERANAIRHDAIERPVSATDHVAGTGRGHTDRGVGTRKIGAPVGGHHELGRTLGGTVRIVTAHRVFLAVSMGPFAILVTLVGRDDDDGARTSGEADRLEHVDRAHDVSRVGLHRLLVGQAHQRLRRQMENKIRTRLGDHGEDGGEVADIALDMTETGAESKLVIQRRFSRRRQREAGDLGSELDQPFGKPGPLETSVPRNKDTFAAIDIRKGHARG